MSPLYLVCGLCGRRQADGLLSRGHWGHLDAGPPYGALQACPTCKEQFSSDWRDRLLAAVNGSTLTPSVAP
jgi:hypothetical protein